MTLATLLWKGDSLSLSLSLGISDEIKIGIPVWPMCIIFLVNSTKELIS